MNEVTLVTHIYKTNHLCKDGKERPDIKRFVRLPNGSLVLVNVVFSDGINKFDAVAEIINDRKED